MSRSNQRYRSLTVIAALTLASAGMATAASSTVWHAGASSQAVPSPVVIKMTAKKYEFGPNKITVERGKPVRLEITATDHDHGFEIVELKLKASIKKGTTEVLEFTPDKAGEFEFKCSTHCGIGHLRMKGKMIVVEPKTSTSGVDF